MSRKNISRSKKLKKSGCGCNRSFRLWGGKKRRTNRHNKKSRKTVRGGYPFVIEQTAPFPGSSCTNTIPFSADTGGSGDPTTPGNMIDARQTNPL